MTSSFEFDQVNKVVCWRLRGEVSEPLFMESLAFVKQILSDTKPAKGIIDFSAVTAFHVSAQAIRQVAGSAPIFPTSMPRVIVASSDHVFGMSRMFASLTEEVRTDVQVVRTMQEAFDLLGIKSPQFQALGLPRNTGT